MAILLWLWMTDGEVRLHKPVVYQPHGLGRRASNVVNGKYVLTGGHKVRFQIGPYDHAKPLVIDPALAYSSYLGGSDTDVGGGIAVDASGNAYITGFAVSSDFPVTAGAFQTTFGGGVEADAFVSKLNAAGSALVYSTYLGGGGFDQGTAIVIDASRNAYVAGWTSSSDFPTTAGAFQTTFGGGGSDAFVSKLSATGSTLLYSTYLGGSGSELGNYFGIAVDASGSAYVTGDTTSSDFPITAGAFQTTYGGGVEVGDAFVTKLNAAGSAVIYSTYLGGSDDEEGTGIAVDASGNAYVSGLTRSSNFPTTSGTFQTTYPGSDDAFVSKLDPAGATLLYSTYLGGSNGARGSANLVRFAVAVDASGNAYVTGYTTCSDFPVTPGAFQGASSGGDDAFVSKLNATGSTLLYSTYLGGSGFDTGGGIAIDASGNAYVIGWTSSSDFPTTAGAFQTTFGGLSDAFVTKLNASGSKLLYSTYLGGSSSEDQTGAGIVVDPSGNAYVTGDTESSDFPTRQGAFQSTSGGGGDAFVSKFSFGIGPPTNIHQCKKGGWKAFTIPRKFKNQGDCVSFVNMGK